MSLKRRIFTKTEHYPQPHDMALSFAFELDDATIDSTIIPILFYDEGLGSPDAQETHPENAAFAVTSQPNVFVNSRIDKINAQLKISLTSKAIDDNIPAIRIAFMVIKMSFKENYIAIDELSSSEVQDILTLQTESTDRQGFPLFAGPKIAEKFTNSSLMHANVPGLTTNQKIEGTAFVASDYYNAIHYKTIAGKLKNSTRGLKWLTLTQNRPIANIKIHIDSKVKRANEYTFYGLLVYCPVVNTTEQIPVTADITAATNYVFCDFYARWNEWNQRFNSKML